MAFQPTCQFSKRRRPIQHKVGYSPLKLRSTLVPVANIGSKFGPILALAGLFFGYNYSESVMFYLFFVVRKNKNQASIVTFGVCYAIIVSVGYNFTCCCVNPARGFGPSVFLAINGDVIILLQFVVISLSTIIGSFIAIILFRCI